MTEVVVAENIDNSSNEETYKFIIDMIDINTISFNVMNTDTGITYKLYIKKESEWCKNNLHKIQNDFSQLYQIINDCINNDKSEFKYILSEEKDNINFKISMKKETKFFKLELDFVLERYISENGIIDDRLNSIEYQLNKLREDNIKAKKILDSLENLVEDINNKNFIKNDDKYKILNNCGNLIYEGHIKNNKRDGEGIEYCQTTGQIIYKGGFKKGYYHGQGTLYNKSNNHCITINEVQYFKGSFKYGLFDELIESYYYNIDKNYKIGHYLARKDYYENGYVIKYELFNIHGTPSGEDEMKHLTECPHNNLAINNDLD
tara:strand:- start:5532 stop:6488 length:957 start_codon:yes stop_codon:yes gene_type:complete